MNKLVCLVLALALSGCSTWGVKEQRMFAVNAACHAYDLIQTDWALEHGFRELNPILGEHPTDNELYLFKAGALSLEYILADQFKGDDRWIFLGLMTIPCIATLAHNYSEGARP